jgi:hypothetical protein
LVLSKARKIGRLKMPGFGAVLLFSAAASANAASYSGGATLGQACAGGVRRTAGATCAATPQAAITNSSLRWSGPKAMLPPVEERLKSSRNAREG